MSTVRKIVTKSSIAEDLRAACTKVAPVWPLESFVAVNPYFGLRSETFHEVAQSMAEVAGARTTMPLTWYAQAFDEGRITESDIDAALAETGLQVDRRALLRALADPQAHTFVADPSVPTVAEVAAQLTDRDWEGLLSERVGAWAASYFDDGQAIWRAAPEGTPYASWRAEATLDRTPEVMGLRGFRKAVAALPANPLAAATEALERLAVPATGRQRYLHRLLMRVGGWSAYAAREVWDRKLYDNEDDDTLFELLAVLLGTEVALYEVLAERGIGKAWAEARATLEGQPAPLDEALARELVMQRALELANDRQLIARFQPHPRPERSERPRVQAIFCIDVRSEVFRRHFEAAGEGVETLGFAGFFAFPISYRKLGHTRSANQCPVLLTPGHEVEETLPDALATQAAVEQRGLRRAVSRAWTTFKMGAVSCFSFVGPVGLAYLPKLLTDGFGVTRPVAHPDVDGLDRADSEARGPDLEGIPLDDRVELAAGALGAMSLTDGFARLVLIAGHGSTTVNNPHASGLDCGACGGRTGEANARVTAATLNDPAVRGALVERGITIPEDTVFVACQHDTTTDRMTVFDRAAIPESHRAELSEVEGWLADAGVATRAERAERLYVDGSDTDRAVLARSRDWAQTRPEWALAGCSAFVVAPRERTQTLDLGGRSFLHSYEWDQDEGFGVLELIMTAPMVVASWINLQYYASTVDNRVFGAGNKTLHNVVGGVGVVEGNGGDLRVGLPWQSVHDGEKLQHEPLRLNVVIEAPIDAMDAIIEKHELVRDLLDNGWLHLFAMDGEGQIAHRYAGGGEWTAVDRDEAGELASAAVA